MAAAGEVIFVQTDPTFKVVWDAMKELRDHLSRLEGRPAVQSAYIKHIERALSEDEVDAHRYTWRSEDDFSRTADACFRMAMLEATGIPKGCRPDIASAANNRIEFEHDPERPFRLATTKAEANHYLSHYSKQYPPSTIREKYAAVEVGQSIQLSSTMVILRGQNFDEMIMIHTAVHLKKGDPTALANAHVYNARVDEVDEHNVHVRCITANIGPGNVTLTPEYETLKTLASNYTKDNEEGKKLVAQLIEDAKPTKSVKTITCTAEHIPQSQ